MGAHHRKSRRGRQGVCGAAGSRSITGFARRLGAERDVLLHQGGPIMPVTAAPPLPAEQTL
jgi:hypothetical protein